MKEASLREVQHHLGDVIRAVEHGEEVVITRRNHAIARLIPERQRRKRISWPDFAARARSLFGRPAGTPLSEIISEDRNDRD